MISNPQPFHPNWYPSRLWCYGYWDMAESLGLHIVRMLRTLQFDEEITNENSAANSDANVWYVKNKASHLFPCDTQILPDPTKTKFKINSGGKGGKKFNIR